MEVPASAVRRGAAEGRAWGPRQPSAAAPWSLLVLVLVLLLLPLLALQVLLVLVLMLLLLLLLHESASWAKCPAKCVKWSPSLCSAMSRCSATTHSSFDGST